MQVYQGKTLSSQMQATHGSSQNSHPSCLHCNPRAQEWCALKADLAMLDAAKTSHVYQPGQMIFYQGNRSLGLYCIESGTVALRKLDSHGNETIVRLAHAGHTLGYRTFFSGAEYSASAQAMTTSRICFIDKATVQKIIERNPSVSMAFLQRVSEDLRDSEEMRWSLVVMPVRARLAKLLLSLRDAHGHLDEHGNLCIELPLSRQDMASMIGARPETLSRTIRSLELDGVAFFQKTSVRIPDLDALLDEVEKTEDSK